MLMHVPWIMALPEERPMQRTHIRRLKEHYLVHMLVWLKQLANFVQGRRVISVACGAEHTLAALETGEVVNLPYCLLSLPLAACLAFHKHVCHMNDACAALHAIAFEQTHKAPCRSPA